MSAGTVFERDVKALLERLGATVTRAAASRGAADLIVLWPDGATWLLQCKRHADGRGASPAEREALASLKAGTRSAIVLRSKKGARWTDNVVAEWL